MDAKAPPAKWTPKQAGEAERNGGKTHSLPPTRGGQVKPTERRSISGSHKNVANKLDDPIQRHLQVRVDVVRAGDAALTALGY